MFKKHWKTPFRFSPYNIRQKEVRIGVDHDTNATTVVHSFPEWDGDTPLGRKILLEQQPDTEGLELHVPEGTQYDSPEMLDKIWAACEAKYDETMYDHNHFGPYQGDIDHEYEPVQYLQKDRDITGMESDTRMRMIQNDLEWMIEERIGKKQIEDGEVKMYKGTLKKWQILDDEVHDRKEIEKLQAAVQAPLPDELEMYKEKHDSRRMLLPFNNENVRAWRDDPVATDSADFDPELLVADRDRRKKYFIERFEAPLQLKE